jgi:hypothetical protein
MAANRSLAVLLTDDMNGRGKPTNRTKGLEEDHKQVAALQSVPAQIEQGVHIAMFRQGQ